MKKLFPLLLLVGCVSEPDERICAEFDSYTLVKERCVPMYGALICVDEEVTEVYCKRYFEEEED